MKPIKTVAFLGLGVMGYPMAGHLQRAGFDVCVYNRTATKAEQWQQEYGGRWAETPKEAAEGADAVLMCVGNDDDVRSVVFGDTGALAGMAAGSLLVDHTTTSADLARELDAACREHQVGFVDAPVSGGQAGAENAKLTIMCGGETTDFDRAVPLFEAMGHRWRRLGPAGSGQLCKMVNQVCIAGLLQGLSEGIRLAQVSGLDVAEVVDVLGGGAAQSWQMDNRALTMAEDKFDFGFAIDWMRKDLEYALAEAKRVGLDMPVADLVNGFYRELQDQGMNRCDTSVLIRRLGTRKA
ncbi:NAD(P)-dependent oxidoreductase [Saccharospirillum salsuginis]|uniref:3-hydroxyisobutyrate dehydrogenase n=1 Tax=Saccharospirillum salsuginis TaxID=418750 RepID=A0A918NF24_9GAMM|nr:NAD(P)-dependent oxidoreductase [Saccharospirillum salsuginis]GGX62439.1 3-hydroxyisobutyrate dehydrogenase [Saccharospirillum salsuginis]